MSVVCKKQQTWSTIVCCPCQCGLCAYCRNHYKQWQVWQTQLASSSVKSQMSKPLVSHLKKNTERNRTASVSFPEPWHDSYGCAGIVDIKPAYDFSQLWWQSIAPTRVITGNIKTKTEIRLCSTISFNIYRQVSLNWRIKTDCVIIIHFDALATLFWKRSCQ